MKNPKREKRPYGRQPIKPCGHATSGDSSRSRFFPLPNMRTGWRKATLSTRTSSVRACPCETRGSRLSQESRPSIEGGGKSLGFGLRRRGCGESVLCHVLCSSGASKRERYTASETFSGTGRLRTTYSWLTCFASSCCRSACLLRRCIPCCSPTYRLHLTALGRRVTRRLTRKS